MAVEYHNHPHWLILHELSEEIEPFYCNACCEVISGSAYFCTQYCYGKKICKFGLHKSCFELPREIQHPLHPLHPLTLRTLQESAGFICDGCRDFSNGFTFTCRGCHFKLDVKCGLQIDDYHSKFEAEAEAENTIYCFIHKHVLTLCNLDARYKSSCRCCNNIISGSAYGCVDCGFWIHKSCLQIPEQIEHPFHPQHPLVFRDIMDDRRDEPRSSCNACGRQIDGVSLRCGERYACDFNLHVACVNPIARSLKHKCHEHNLFYFGKDSSPLFHRCLKCRGVDTVSGPRYSCMTCGYSFHLECIPIPDVVKHKRHLHPLRLVDSVEEDDSDEYYCDVCETPGNPKHHAYYCEECSYIAHIECVITENGSSLEILSSSNIGFKDKTELHNDTKEDLNDTCDNKILESAEKSDEGQEAEAQAEEPSNDEKDCSLAELEKRITSVSIKMEALASEVEVLAKLDKRMGNVMIKMKALVSEFEAARNEPTN